MEIKEQLKNYLNTHSMLTKWCINATELIYSYKWVDRWGYWCHFCLPDYDFFELTATEIIIHTLERFGGEIEYDEINIPIEVFYNDSLKQYIDDLYEKKCIEIEEQKQKEAEEKRNEAIKQIERLKKEFNI